MDRTTYIGSSDCAAILGLSPWQSKFMCYQKKTGGYVEEIDAAKQKLFDRGKRFEPVIAEMLVDELRERGHAVEVLATNERYIDPAYPFIASEIDIELLIDGEEVNGEIKSVNGFAAKNWGEPGTDEIPIYYAAQVMHGLMVKPRKRTIVAALIGTDDLRIHWVERDDETIAAIREKELEFWTHVQTRIAPDPETHDDVKWLFKKDTGATIEAPQEIYQLVENLKLLQEGLKSTENGIDLYQAKIKSFMKEAATLTYGGRPVMTWKTNKPSLKTNWEQAAKDAYQGDNWPGFIEKYCAEVTGARPLKFKK